MLKTVVNKMLDLLIVCGTSAFFFIGAFNYDIGTLNEMGPGFLPAVFGGVGLFLGAIVFLLELKPAGARSNEKSDIQWPLREFAFIAVSILIFSILLEHLGLFLTAFLSILVCSGASHERYNWRRTMAWALALSSITCVVFIFALGLSMKFLPPWM